MPRVLYAWYGHLFAEKALSCVTSRAGADALISLCEQRRRKPQIKSEGCSGPFQLLRAGHRYAMRRGYR